MPSRFRAIVRRAPVLIAALALPPLYDRTVAPLTGPETVDTITVETREATSPAFDLTPDGQSIVFDLYGQLWRLPIAGGDAVPITDAVRETAEDVDPAVRPDGGWIVFQSDRPGGRALWLMPMGGGEARRLTSRYIGYFAYATPAWSRDGRRIAYAVRDTVALIDLAENTETVLRIDSLPAPSRRQGFVPRNTSPAWSPDGERIAFVNTASDPVRGDGLIWEVPAAGGTARPITSIRGVAPAWSPDGSQLGFFSRDSAGRWQVYVQPKDAPPRRLTDHAETVTYRVRWTPDGRSLVYAADGGLWRVSLAGGPPEAIPFRARLVIPRGRATLAPNRFSPPNAVKGAKGFAAIALAPDAKRIAMIALDSLWVFEPGKAPSSLGPAAEAGDNTLAWSPDGADLAWTRREGPGRPYELVLTDARTGAGRVMVSLGLDVFAPAWSPDGKWLAMVAGGRLRLVDPRGDRVTKLDQARDLGPANLGWGTMTWSPRSDGLVIVGMDLEARRQRAEWVPLGGARRPLARFPRGAANLRWHADGSAVWVEDNRLVGAPFDSSGHIGEPRPLSDDPAVEARHAADGSILYLSVAGLKLRTASGAVRQVPWPLRYRVAAAPPPLLIRGARVIDGRGTPLSAPSDVLVQGGRIARMGPAGTVPAGAARVLDAEGSYLLPGYLDLHAHLWDDLSLLAWLHNGVTTIRDIASQRVKTLDTRNRVEAGLAEGPRLVYGGAVFHGMGSGYTSLGDQMNGDSASIARGMAILAGMGAGYVKERGFEEWWRAAHLVGEAHRYGITVSGHCEHVLPAIAAGMDGMEHVLDCKRDRYTLRGDYAELLRASGLWVVPTAALYWTVVRGMHDSSVASGPEIDPFLARSYRALYTADAANRRNYERFSAAVVRVQRGVRRLREAGVTIASGGDTPYPLGIQQEMEVLVESGLTPMEAIVAATGAAAKVLNAPEIGTIGEGQWADLVLLSANPLEDIRNTRKIREVIQGGRVVDRESLRKRGLSP